MESKRQKSLKDAPDPALLARIREAVEAYDISELEDTMEELEQCSYEPDTDLISWLREQIDKSEFDGITVRLMPREEDVVLFVEP
jgi:hypothetical protein